jgi:hypothetical protein
VARVHMSRTSFSHVFQSCDMTLTHGVYCHRIVFLEAKVYLGRDAFISGRIIGCHQACSLTKAQQKPDFAVGSRLSNPGENLFIPLLLVRALMKYSFEHASMRSDVVEPDI